MEKFITVTNDKGQNIKLEIIETIDLNNKQYLIVAGEDSDVAYAYKPVTTNGEVEYVSLKEGPEFQKVLKKYNEHLH